MPNTPGTPKRSIRISDHLWEAAQATADELDENLSEEIRKFLERYTRKKARS